MRDEHGAAPAAEPKYNAFWRNFFFFLGMSCILTGTFLSFGLCPTLFVAGFFCLVLTIFNLPDGPKTEVQDHDNYSI